MQEAAKALAVSARWGKLLRKFQVQVLHQFAHYSIPYSVCNICTLCMDILPLFCVCTVTLDQFLKCLQRRARREEADTITAAEKQRVPSFSNCVLLPVRGTSVVFDEQRTSSSHSSSTVLFFIMCRSYGLDSSGALLTCVRTHLAEWRSGYEASCEATMDLLGHSPFLLSLLSTFLTNKVRDELVQVQVYT